jgi:hypothetical protein
MSDSDNDKTVKMESVPPFSSGTLEQSSRLLQTGMMQPPQTPGALGTIGKYQVVRILGEGGMGQVLLARDPVTDSLVAIKIIKPEYVQRDWAVHRFLSEARHIFNMAHPSIIRVLEVSDRPEGPYFVMPFMAGGSLAQKIKPGESLPPDSLVAIARRVAEALHYAHSRGVLHRDLKPSNILLDADGHACLCDFGLLRTVFNDSIVDVTQPQIEGTVPYMSPAVAAGQAEDTRGDIYSFGCLLYEMLTGQPPYQGPTVDSVLRQILAGPPQPIRQVNPNASAHLAAIAEGAMARELRDRYADMSDVISDLERVSQKKAPVGPSGRDKVSHLGLKVVAVVGVLAVLALVALGVSHLMDRAPAAPPSAGTNAAPAAVASVVATNVPPAAPENHFNCATNNGAITITKYTGPGGDVRIPGTINDLPVTCIGNYAFCGCGALTSVTIPDSVKNIGFAAFFGCGLTNVTLGSGLNIIGNQSFASCGGLTSITIPKRVTSIEVGAFWRCNGLTSVTIPASVTSIGSNPFSCCDKLQSLTVDATNPAYVSSAEGIVFNKDKTCIVSYPSGKSGSYVIPGSVTSIASRAFCYCTGLTNVAIPNGVVSIGDFAFERCSLTNVTIPNGVISIEDWAFSDCRVLSSVTIPASVTKLGGNPFRVCSSLTSILVDVANSAFCSSEDGVLFDKQKTSLLAYPAGKPGSYEITNSVTKIGPNAFQECPYLTSVILPDTITSIGSEAFRGCQNLTAVYVKGSPPRLDRDVFTDSPKAKIYYPPGVKGWALEFGGRPTEALALPGQPAVVAPAPAAPSPFVSRSTRRTVSADESDQSESRRQSRTQTIERLNAMLKNTTAPDAQQRLRNYIQMLEKANEAEAAGGGPNAAAPPPSSPPEHFTCTANNNQATITKYTGPGGVVVIPDKINGQPVTVIGDHAFRGNASLTRVTIPNGVTSVGVAAFRDCTELSRVTLPETLTSIGNEAFWCCVRMTRVRIPKNVTGIGTYAFAFCGSLRTIEVDAANSTFSSGPDGVVFNKDKTRLVCHPCGRLGSYEIPDGVAEIGAGAFARCFNLTGVTIPGSVKVIDNWAFQESGLTSLKIPDSVTRIGDWAFHECAKLASVEIPDSVTSIGREAFYDCAALTNAVIGKGVTSIAAKPFLRCNSRIKIKVDPANPAYWSNPDGVVFNKDKTLLVLCPTGKSGSYKIPKGVTKINEGAFQWCTNLTSVTIPGSVTNIGDQAFLGSGLTNVVIPDSVKVIEGMAFTDCTNLTSVTIPNSVTSIGHGVFGGRIKLSAVKIPNSVTHMGGNPFTGGWWGGSGLASILVDPENPNYTSVDGAVFNKEKTLIIGYPPAKGGSYTIPNGVARIGGIAFEGCHALTSLIVPESVTVVEGRSFMACPNLASIIFKGDAPQVHSDSYLFWGTGRATIFHPPGAKGWGKTLFDRPVFPMSGDFGYTTENDKITLVKYVGPGGDVTIPSEINGQPVARIGNNAFDNCTNVTSVTIPDSIISVGEWAFVGCSNLTSVAIPNGVKDIGMAAFYRCPSLTSVKIPASVTSIGRGVFCYCTKLNSITVDASNPAYSNSADGVLFNKDRTCLVSYAVGRAGNYVIPNTVTQVGPNAFEGCDKLTDVTIPDSVTSLGWWVFTACEKLTNVSIPNSVTIIGGSAFENCTNLCQVAIGSRVSSIEWSAFRNCNKLTAVAIPDSTTSIGDRAFWGCNSLTNVTIPRSVTSIGINPFDVCRGLRSITVDPENPAYCSSAEGVLFDKKVTRLISYPGGRAGSYVIPNSATDIGISSFAGSIKLTRVTIPQSVTTIGNCGFWGCTNLASVYFTGHAPSGIHDGSIFGDVNNATVYYQPGTTGWGKHFGGRPTALLSLSAGDFDCAFGDNGVILTQYTGPGGAVILPSEVCGLPVTALGSRAFRDCTNVTSVTIPKSVTAVGVFTRSAPMPPLRNVPTVGRVTLGSVYNPFDDCKNLTAVTVEEDNPAFSSKDDVLFNKEKTLLVCYPAGKTGSPVIPDGITAIAPRAFGNCASLTTVTIPASVTNMSYGAFAGCSELTEVRFKGNAPEAPRSNRNAFDGAGRAVIYYPLGTKGWESKLDGRPAYPVRDGYAYTMETNAITLVRYLGPGGTVTVPARLNDMPVVNIGGETFQNLTNVTSVKIPASVTNINWDAFVACSGLASMNVDAGNPVFTSTADGVVFSKDKTQLVRYPIGKQGNYVIPSGVTTVGPRAMMGCAELTGITIPNSVTTIDGQAFMGCDSLKTVTIPASVTSIGGNTFTHCKRLNTLLVDAANPTYCSSADGVVFSKDKTRLCHYPSGKAGHYTAPGGLTRLEGCSFEGCPNLTSVTIPEGVTVVGAYAFKDSTNLVSVTLPNTVHTLEHRSFWGCFSLENITIPDSVTHIQECAFIYCRNLTNAVIGGGVTCLDGWAFGSCGNLTALYFKGNAPECNPGAFSGTGRATVFYCEGTTGWGKTLAGRPTALWAGQTPAAPTSQTNAHLKKWLELHPKSDANGDSILTASELWADRLERLPKQSGGSEETLEFDWQNADISQVLIKYSELSKRNAAAGEATPTAVSGITFRTSLALTATEAITALECVILMDCGLSIEPEGEKSFKLSPLTPGKTEQIPVTWIISAKPLRPVSSAPAVLRIRADDLQRR